MRPWMKYNFFDKFWSEGLRATSNLGKIGTEAFARRNVLSESREDLLSYLLADKNETAVLWLFNSQRTTHRRRNHSGVHQLYRRR